MLVALAFDGILLILRLPTNPMKNRKLVPGAKLNIRTLRLEEILYPKRSLFFSLKRFSTRLVFFVATFLATTSLRAQENAEIDPMPIKLKGQVLNLEDESPVPNAFIMNFRTHTGVTADDQGRFLMDMLNIDSISVSSLGFTKIVVHIPLNYKEINVFTIYAKPVRFAVPDVNVHGKKQEVNMEGVPVAKKSDIDPELRGDAYNKRPPVLAAVFNPVSYLQYYTSKRERQKREAREAIVTEKHWAQLSQIYNKELVMELTGLSDSDADKLMIYINSKGLLSHMSNDYDVRTTIKEQYQLFKAEGH